MGGDAGTADASPPVDAGPPVDAAPLDPCPYPESLGGGGVEGECGFTPGAWYPLGNSDLTTWPDRADETTTDGGLAPACPTRPRGSSTSRSTRQASR